MLISSLLAACDISLTEVALDLNGKPHGEYRGSTEDWAEVCTVTSCLFSKFLSS